MRQEREESAQPEDAVLPNMELLDAQAAGGKTFKNRYKKLINKTIPL